MAMPRTKKVPGDQIDREGTAAARTCGPPQRGGILRRLFAFFAAGLSNRNSKAVSAAASMQLSRPGGASAPTRVALAAPAEEWRRSGAGNGGRDKD
jgi:hypothetical protein